MQDPKLTKVFKQVVRYGITGVLNNFWWYFFYLLVTWLGVDPRLTVSMLYPIAAFFAYFAHSKYSFEYKGGQASAKFRFILAQLFGYLINVLMLSIFVESFGYPHQVVQAVAIFVTAGVLFFLLRHYVFAEAKKGS